jgi:phage N-6-adenine-methyltransferase
MKGQTTLFQTGTGETRTPQDFFSRLDREFQFDLDAAATKKNALCERYFTKKDSAFDHKWTGSVYVNPPYGRGIPQWCEKACAESKHNAITVVMLLPARTDTRWFHDCIMKHPHEVRFLPGRLKFEGEKDAAPFPSMVVIWRMWHRMFRNVQFKTWDWRRDPPWTP